MKTLLNRRWWDLPAAALLMVALLTAATRLVATRWTVHLALTQTLVFFGVIAGLALGQSRFSPRVAAFFAIAYGLFAVPWQVGLLEESSFEWREKLLSLAGRLNIITNQIIHGEVVQDSLLFVVLMAALFWILSVYAGYTLTRYGNAWRSTLPTGLTLLVIHSFDPLIARRALYLAVFLFFTLVLVARMSFLQQHDRWEKSRTSLPPHLGLDFIRFTLLACGLIVLFSWTAPALANALPAAAKAYQPIKDTWNEVRDNFDNAFASLRSTVGVVSEYYGSSMLLGRGNKLTDKPVFQVKPPADAPSTIRYYWRARTYDTYRDGQWLSSNTISRPFTPDQEPAIPNDNGRFLGAYDFSAMSSLTTLYSPAQPLWVSRPGLMELLTNKDGTFDLIGFRASPPLQAGSAYQAQASVSNVTISQMREAGTTYPNWVLGRYLQLPGSITQRTKQLAKDITAGLENPYDKVVAITNYLRNNITYSDVIPSPPTRQDSMDWFLFDLKQGFCNYYASAEVILLRSIGIPARWSVGYAQGELQKDGTYLVRQRDAHAWPEVYFPGLGWIEFEPTAAQPSLNYPAGETNPNDPNSNAANNTQADEARRLAEEELRLARRDQREALSGEGTAPTTQSITRTAIWAVPLIILLGILGVIIWRNSYRLDFNRVPITIEKAFIKTGIRPPAALQRWALHASLPPLTRAYQEINHALARLGSRPKPTFTPAERAEILAQILPPASVPAQQLVSEYQIGTFSPQPANLETAQKSGREIRELSFKESFKKLFQRILNRIQRPRVQNSLQNSRPKS